MSALRKINAKLRTGIFTYWAFREPHFCIGNFGTGNPDWRFRSRSYAFNTLSV